ncbi:MAG: hypothetical protein J5641_02055 [Bacteroidales bacterium]|nr:hypothetical protein [Bacteroidales bacterium]
MTKSNKHLAILLGLFVLPVLMFTGCLKEGDETIVLPLPNGKIPYDVIPERIQDSLTEHGFVIHEGVYPPKIEGKYVASPMDQEYASDNYYNPNFRYLYMAFAGQQRRGKINYSQVQNDTIILNEQQFTAAVGDASRAQVIGENDNFTMYCIQEIRPDDDSWWCKTASVVSGTFTKAGIKDCQYAEYIIDRGGDVSRLSEVGTYRIWNDGDKLASPIFNPTEK